MKIKRVLSVFLAAALTVISAGCKKSKNNSASVGAALAQVSEQTGKFSYTVIRGKNAATEVSEAAKALRTALKKTFDANVTLTFDETVEDYDGNTEILIGSTNREESDKALEVLKNNRVNYYRDFIIKVIDDKLCINAANDSVLISAVEYFTENYCKDKEKWGTLSTKSEIIYEAPFNALDHKIMGNSLSAYKLVVPADMSYVYGMRLDELNDYLFESQGFQLSVDDERETPAEYEIVLADAERDGLPEVTLDKNGWIIKAAGKKLIIKGENDLATGAAVQKLLSLIKEADGSGKPLELAENFELGGSYTAENAEDYKLVWSDEFNGSQINHHWWVDYNSQYPYGKQSSSVLGGTITNMAAANVKSNGDGTASVYAEQKGKDIKSGAISTWDTMQYRYGVLEIRARLPIAPWCASLWLNASKLGYGAMTEFDLLENFGYNTSFASNIHLWSDMWHKSLDTTEYKAKKKYTLSEHNKFDKNLTDEFHIYTMEWTDRIVNFAVDGRVYFSYSLDDDIYADARRLPSYLVLSCGGGSGNYGVAFTEEKDEYAELVLDYVRIYQRSDIDSLLLTRDDPGGIPNYDGRKMKHVVSGKEVS